MSFVDPRKQSARDAAWSPHAELKKFRGDCFPAGAGGAARLAFAGGAVSGAEDIGLGGQAGAPLIVRVCPAIAHADGHFDASGRQAQIRRALVFDSKTFI